MQTMNITTTSLLKLPSDASKNTFRISASACNSIDTKSWEVMGTLRSVKCCLSVSDVSRHRSLSIGYVLLLPCHGNILFPRMRLTVGQWFTTLLPRAEICAKHKMITIFGAFQPENARTDWLLSGKSAAKQFAVWDRSETGDHFWQQYRHGFARWLATESRPLDQDGQLLPSPRIS
jgi:hypothetical protein